VTARPELIPARPAWYEGRFARWLTTTDHKQIGILHVSTALLWLVLGGILVLVMHSKTVVPTAGSRGYSEVFTLHLTAAMFLVVVPVVMGLAVFLVPLMIGAREITFPRLNAFAYWLYLVGSGTLFAAFLHAGTGACGWTCYAPFSQSNNSHTGDLWLLALLMLSFALVLGPIVVITTIRTLRTEGMTWERMPIFARAIDVYSWLLIAAVFVLDATLVLLLLDRRGTTHVFDGRTGLLRDLLWSLGYPEVALLVLPALGIAAEVLHTVSRRRTPALFILGGLATVPIVLLGGVLLAALPHHAPLGWDFVRTVLDDALLVGSLLVFLGGLHYWWPKLFGRMLGERLGTVSFWLSFAGLNLAFFPAYLHTSAPVYAYPHHAGWGTYQTVSTVGLALLACGVLLFLANVLRTHALRLGTRAGNDPWRGDTLEWYTTSPPPPCNFERVPPVTSAHPLRDLRRRLEEQGAF
jgi:Heme/copper-type cytochrome/quinol oxidases, subunit 1